VLEAEDILSVVPEGRESAETTMNQNDAADPPTADAGAAAAEATAAEAARLDAIEQRQDEAEEILVYLETAILPIVESVTTARKADEFAQRVDETIIRLGKCHGFFRQRDKANHAAKLGPRIEEALAQLRDVLMRLTQLRAAETEEEESEPEPERPSDPPPAGPPPPDPVFLESTKTAMITATAKLSSLCVEAKEFTESKRPTEDSDIYRLTEEFKLLSAQIGGACAKATAMAARAISCKLYTEEAALTTLITDTEGGKVAAQKVLMSWRREAGVFAEKMGCGNRAAVKAPTFTGKPKSLSIYEFIKDWTSFKADSNCTVNEALKELKAAVREADKEVTRDMDTEEAILEHLIERFGNPIEMIRSREAEFTSWKPSKGTYEQRRDWFAHARARLQNIIELCTEHEVLDHLYDSQLNRLFQQKLDEDSIDILMEIFRKAMGKLKSLPKAELYPCRLELCDEQIAKLSTRVTMLANPDTAYQADAQGKGGSGGGSGGSGSGAANSGGWKNKSRQGVHTANQDGSGGGAVRKGGDGTAPKNTSSKKCAFCSGFHPFMFYCEHFIKAKVKDRFTMVLKQKSCSRCLSMGRSFDGKRDIWWPDHEPYCKMFLYVRKALAKMLQRINNAILLCVLHITSKTLP
jgi:hypothetical protein